MKCVSCLAGFHGSCLEASCGCNHASSEAPAIDPSPTTKDDSNVDEPEDDVESRGSLSRSTSGRNGNRRLKRDATLKDQQSTGRKRAARMYPLDPESACEWQGLRECGGGITPILGCLSGLQQARHHGPDKSVSNNEEGNVHRICHFCHNRWHAANNEEYDWNTTKVKKHDPVPMTEADKFQAIINQENSKSKQFSKITD